MKKLTLVGLSDEKSKIFKTLTKEFSVHVDFSPEYEDTSALTIDRDLLDQKFKRVAGALSLSDGIKKRAISLNSYTFAEIKAFEKAVEKKGKERAEQENGFIYAESLDQTKLNLYSKPKKDFFPAAKILSFDSFNKIVERESEIEKDISLLEDTYKRLNEIKTELVRLSVLKNQLLLYRKFDAPFSSVKDGKNHCFFLGTLPINGALNLENKINALDYASATIVKDVFNDVVIFIVCHKEQKQTVSALVSEAGVTVCPFDYEMTAEQKIAELNKEMGALGSETKKLAFRAANVNTDDIKTLYDFYSLEVSKANAAEKCRATAKTFLLTAWIPVTRLEDLQNTLESYDSVVAYDFADPTDEETPPTLIASPNKAVDSFQTITNMYSLPNYRDRDPNTFVAVFYFLFFGIMLGDVGYGLIVAAACFAIYYLQKRTLKQSKMILMFGWCGISMIIWGIIFGSVFGATIIKPLPVGDGTFKPLLDASGVDVMLFFVLSLGCGALQLLVGFALGGIDKARKLKGTALQKAAVVFNNYAWVVLLTAVFFISPIVTDMFGVTEGLAERAATLVNVGKYIALVGIIMLVVGGILGKKNPLKMAGGVFGNFYGAINVASDILSYSRLFGLGLTSCIIGFVVNNLGSIIVDLIAGGAWWGWIIAAPILVFGHALNIGINIIGTYVHDARLQFIEFFGHFFDGGGREYTPLGSAVKYSFIDYKK